MQTAPATDLTPQQLDELFGVAVTPRRRRGDDGENLPWLPAYDGEQPPF